MLDSQVHCMSAVGITEPITLLPMRSPENGCGLLGLRADGQVHGYDGPVCSQDVHALLI